MHVLNKEASPKGYILDDSNHVTFWKRHNCGDSKWISGRQWLGGGAGMNRGAQRAFRAVTSPV